MIDIKLHEFIKLYQDSSFDIFFIGYSNETQTNDDFLEISTKREAYNLYKNYNVLSFFIGIDYFHQPALYVILEQQ